METNQLKQALTPTFTLLKFTFGIVPIVAGLDKFTNVLTTWEMYLNPSLVGMLPFSAGAFMMIVGVVEILAGVLVFAKTEWGGYLVAGWLTLVALTLLGGFMYVDVAVRDLVMAIAAFAMARMAKFIS